MKFTLVVVALSCLAVFAPASQADPTADPAFAGVLSLRAQVIAGVAQIIATLRATGETEKTLELIAKWNKLVEVLSALVELGMNLSGGKDLFAAAAKPQIILSLNAILIKALTFIQGELAGLQHLFEGKPIAGPLFDLLRAEIDCLIERLGKEIPKLQTGLNQSLGGFIIAINYLAANEIVFGIIFFAPECCISSKLLEPLVKIVEDSTPSAPPEIAPQ